MAGLLDFLSIAGDIANPIGAMRRGLLSNLPQMLPQSNSGPNYDSMYGMTSFEPTMPSQPAPVAPYPQGTDPMTAGGLPPQSMPFTAPQAAPLSQGIPNPIAVGDYQMPRVGNPGLFQPQTAPTDVSAQSRAPQQQQMELPPSSLTSNGGFFRGVANNLHNGPIGALVGGIGNALGMQDPAQQNLRAQFQVLARQVGPEKAMIALLNPKAGESIFAEAFGTKDAPKTVEEFAVRNAWQNRNRPGASTGGLPTTLQGIQEWKASEKAAEKRATTMAEEQAKRAVSLPSTLERAKESIKQIDELKAHSWKGWRTGAPSMLPGVPGTGGADFDERVKQLKGAAFLEAYGNLRGTGAISEAEGIKAEQAQARLSQAKSPKDFDQALDDLRDVLVRGYANAQKMAGEEKIQSYEMPIGQSRTINNVTIKRVK